MNQESSEGVTVVAVLGRGPITETIAVRRGDRELALKRLLPHAESTGEARADLAREARIVAALAGRGAPPFASAGEDRHGPWVATERWPGRTLAALDPAEVRAHFGAIARAAFAALAAVHEAADERGPLGVVHGDISRDNVLVAGDFASCALVDFQLAGDREGGPPRDGAFRGTIATVAPEVARGEAPSCAADCFALAASLVEAVHGAPLRPEGIDQAVRIVLAAEQPVEFDAALLEAWIPARAARVLAACLAHDPKKRPPSARAVLAALSS